MVFPKYAVFLPLTLVTQLFLCLNAEKFEKNASEEDGELIFAHVVFRHGARNIAIPFPNDPWKNESHWSGGFGALTNIGQMEAYEVGKFLLKRYERLIGTSYSPKKVYIRSTDVDRTLMTAQCCAAALFRPSEDQVWNDKIQWYPVPIHTVQLHKDYLLAPMVKCPHFHKLLGEFLNSSEMKAHLEEHRELIEFIKIKSGMSIRSLPNLHEVYDTLHIERQQGLRLEDWANEVLDLHGETLYNLTVLYYEARTHTTEMKKLMAGYLIKEIMDRFKGKISSPSTTDLSLVIYSAHDLTIAFVLNALNLYDMEIPPNASSLHLELYKRNKSYFVQIHYRKPPSEELTHLNIPSCGKMCPLDKFYELYEHILPTESFSSACGSE